MLSIMGCIRLPLLLLFASPTRCQAFAYAKSYLRMATVRVPAMKMASSLSSWEDIDGTRVRYRQGDLKDTPQIALQLLSMKMNPLGIFDPSAFLVCEGPEGEVIGFGQIRKLAEDSAADPSAFDARPGTASPDAAADDDAWEDFERELPDQPQGLVMPWSPMYKEMQKRAELQQQRRKARIEAAASSAAPLWELASLVVAADWRGRGVGSSLVRRLLERHQGQQGHSLSDIYLITLAPTCPFYEVLGFRRLEERRLVPKQMAFEVAAGQVLSAVLGNELACMRYDGR